MSHIASAPESVELSEELERLAENMYWTWNRKVRRIFERIDQAAWDGLGHNPILLLRNMGRARLQELASSSDFKSAVAEA
ncbi:MAG: DUF3417 domain-containing protein, partial [Nitrososphaerales archaeon]